MNFNLCVRNYARISNIFWIAVKNSFGEYEVGPLKGSGFSCLIWPVLWRILALACFLLVPSHQAEISGPVFIFPSFEPWLFESFKMKCCGDQNFIQAINLNVRYFGDQIPHALAIWQKSQILKISEIRTCNHQTIKFQFDACHKCFIQSCINSDPRSVVFISRLQQ